jgi:hypothetical protein
MKGQIGEEGWEATVGAQDFSYNYGNMIYRYEIE